MEETIVPLQFELKYFKPSGKFYTEEFATIPSTLTWKGGTPARLYMPGISDYVRANYMKEGFDCLINHPLGYPVLVRA